MGLIERDRVHERMTAWVNAHDAGDMTEDDVLAVFDFIAEMRAWLNVEPEPTQGAVDLDGATERVEELMIRAFHARPGEETRRQAKRLARVALGGQS